MNRLVNAMWRAVSADVHVLICVWFCSQKGTFRLKGSRCRRACMTFISLKLRNKGQGQQRRCTRRSKVIRKVTVWYGTSVVDLGLFEEWCGCGIRPITRGFEGGDSRPNAMKESRGWRSVGLDEHRSFRKLWVRPSRKRFYSTSESWW